MSPQTSTVSLYPPGGFGAPKDRHGHANGTNVEGEWEEVMAAIRACHEALHAMGVPRIHTDIKLGTRVDRDQHMADKTASVLARMPS